MARVLAVVARKGGCGKTSISASLCAVSVSRAFPCVTVDADSQASMTRWALGDESVQLGWMQTVAALQWPVSGFAEADSPTMAAAKTREQLLEAVLPLCVHKSEQLVGLSIVPSANHVHIESVPELVLSGLPFDLVVVDCPPDISSPLVRSVLRQADAVVSPVQCEPWAAKTMEATAREIVSVGRQDLLDEGLLRFVINMRAKCSLHEVVEKSIRKSWGRMVSPTVIPRSVSVAEASYSPPLLTKTNPLFKAGSAILAEIEKQTKRKAA